MVVSRLCDFRNQLGVASTKRAVVFLEIEQLILQVDFTLVLALSALRMLVATSPDYLTS